MDVVIGSWVQISKQIDNEKVIFIAEYSWENPIADSNILFVISVPEDAILRLRCAAKKYLGHVLDKTRLCLPQGRLQELSRKQKSSMWQRHNFSYNGSKTEGRQWKVFPDLNECIFLQMWDTRRNVA